MTIQHLLEKLEQKRNALDVAISEIRNLQANTHIRTKAKAIIKSVHRPKKKLHWLQTKEGKVRMSKIMLNKWKEKK